MNVLIYLPAVLSSLYRISVYIFLRVIPISLATFVLPSLYALHILSSWLLAPQSLPPVSSEKAGELKRQPKENPLQTIILSLPTTSRRLRLSNIIINTLLFAAVVDFVLTPFLDPAISVVFTRVGAVYPDRVKIVARYPELNPTNEIRLRVKFRETKSVGLNPWSDGPVLAIKEDNDWVGTVNLTGLWPNTPYEYTLSTINGTILPYPPSPIRFRTFPDPRLSTGNHFRFVASSCMIPNHPYRGPFYRRAIKGFDLLADYIHPNGNKQANPTQLPENAPDASYETLTKTIEKRPSFIPVEFLLFLGDFIYADLPIYVGDDREAYRRLYRRNYQSDSFRKVYEHIPIFHAYDDHEFTNNFGAGGNDSTPPYPNASSAFRTYNSDANYDPANPGEYYYDFQYGDVAFFVLDTRRYRVGLQAPNRTMLGDVQLASLQKWLSRVNETSTFKFIVTSVPFTSLWDQTDTWAGFPDEKQVLLDAFHSVPNVIILSGDRHEFAAIEFSSQNPEHYPVWEFSTSPLSMFYVPLIRTLRLQSDTTIRRNITSAENGSEIVNSVEEIPMERVVKYLYQGNHKWSTLEVNTKDSERPTLSLEVMIDGKPSFSFEIVGISIKHQSSNALGAYVASGMKGIFDRLGLHPNKWY